MIDPLHWNEDDFERERNIAIEAFRRERIDEPLEAYLRSFDEYQSVIEELLETTVDLSEIEDNALGILTNRNLQVAFRYLAGPPISGDDLKTLAEAQSVSRRALSSDPELVKRLVGVVMQCLDRRRFAWVSEDREPTEAEKNAAVVASAALLASQRLSTARRSEGKEVQEGAVKSALVKLGFNEVKTRTITTIAKAPAQGEFCGECVLGTRKADFVLRLWDERIMPIECKVSNSALNSVKRLNNDAAVKAESWKSDFGTRQVVPTAVLSGVYSMRSLTEAQERGLTLIWAHDLGQLTAWIESTR